MSLVMWIGPVVGVGSLLFALRRANLRPRARLHREAIDIDLVLEEKYPNRRFARVRRSAALVGAPSRVEATVVIPEAPPAPPAPEWPEPAAPRGFYAPPRVDAPPWAPIPGEPGGDLFMGPPRRPARIADTPEGPRLVASPYEALRRRRDRVAKQAAAAFADVHRLRTESLRRASQAEHNAELATSARVRASRMTRESRRYEAQGRSRSAAVPDAGDAFHDVHRFRVEALRRAHEAEHGAESVAQARQRAARLLAEQRRIEAEMSRLRRGGVPGTGENL